MADERMTDGGTPGDNGRRLHDERWELLRHVNELTEGPMIALSFVWLGLLVWELAAGLNPTLEVLGYVIWALFILDFLVELTIAPRKGEYLRHNWLTVVSLLLPALRVLRIFRAVRLLRAARFGRSVNLVRLVTSLNRGMRATRNALGRRGIGYLVLLTVLITFAGAAGMAFFESSTSLAQEGAGRQTGLDSYGDALWWTAMIITTLGSDYWPRTLEGRILGWLLALYAFAIFGYITATLASFFIGKDITSRQVPDASEGIGPEEATSLRIEIAALRREIALLTSMIKAEDRARPGD